VSLGESPTIRDTHLLNRFRKFEDQNRWQIYEEIICICRKFSRGCQPDPRGLQPWRTIVGLDLMGI